MHGSAQSYGSEQYPRGSILEPLCHGSVEMMSRAVNDFYLEHWPFPDEKARKKFVIAGFPTVTCLYFPKGLESRMPQACSLLSILFLIDDQLECMSLEEGKAYNDRLKPLCRGESLPSRSDPVGWIMYDLWESMRATEPELAHGIIEPLFAFMDAQTSKARLQINDITQYLEYRQADVGQALVSLWRDDKVVDITNFSSLLATLTRYTMNLHISVEELESVAGIEENCGRHISLVNDIYSYEKELLASQSTTHEGAILCNAHKGKPFYVPTPFGERLMLPNKYVEELKNAPMEDVDFLGSFFEVDERLLIAEKMFESEYTTLGSRSILHPQAAKVHLNRYMEWTEVCMASEMSMVVARASSRMFGGLSLSRNREWLQTTLNYASDGFVGAQKIKALPRIFRPCVAPFLPEVRRMPGHYKTARKIIVPILQKREAESAKCCDFLEWMTADAGGPQSDHNMIADLQLKMSLAALHTTAATVVQLLYDLCCMPQYISALREEVEAVQARYSEWDKQALLELDRMDSFMKESLRHNPLLLVTLQRIVHRDLVLSDGFLIPAGTLIGVPSQAVGMDAAQITDPHTFQGFRFTKIREVTVSVAEKGRTHWAASNLDHLAFGYGRHVCPGRFFASNEIKLIMVHLLMSYDFEFAEGLKDRPKNLCAEIQLIPNPETRVRVRRRE
ncbi:MAG: hypothetical protein Q9191_001923 [Dirinaria sp. TL-2023a]